MGLDSWASLRSLQVCLRWSGAFLLPIPHTPTRARKRHTPSRLRNSNPHSSIQNSTEKLIHTQLHEYTAPQMLILLITFSCLAEQRMVVLDSFWQTSQPRAAATQWWPHHKPGQAEQEGTFTAKGGTICLPQASGIDTHAHHTQVCLGSSSVVISAHLEFVSQFILCQCIALQQHSRAGYGARCAVAAADMLSGRRQHITHKLCQPGPAWGNGQRSLYGRMSGCRQITRQ